jgi:hypothetical protein
MTRHVGSPCGSPLNGARWVALFALLLAGAAHGEDLRAVRDSLFGRPPATATAADRAWATNLAASTGNPAPRVGRIDALPGSPGVTGSRARLETMEATRLEFPDEAAARAWAEDYWKKHQEHLRRNPGAFLPQALDVSGNTVTILEGPGVRDPAKRKKALAAARGPGRSALRGTSDRTAEPLKEGDGIEDRLADLFGTPRADTAAVATPGTGRPRPGGGSPGGGSPGGGSPGGGSPGGGSPGGGSPGGGSPAGNDTPATNDANAPATNDAAANDPAANEAPAEPAGPAWLKYHGGITQGNLQIPRAGLRNNTLRAALGVAVEPYGTVTQKEGKQFVQGRSSTFGGSSDTGVGRNETGALTGERLRGLTGFFVAMRFDYGPGGKAAWVNKRLLVVNPANGKAVVVRCVDWGPNTSTRRTVDLSPQAMRALGMATDSSPLVAFATANAPLGLVPETPPAPTTPAR